ncbi:MAG: TnsA endonuclease C-terminal domain-containing protein [Anaeromusa sp.]|uniref:TnsA endonuclease C-terminal domain-containing protein n=1 Tax=Anaeromusa sp. TaxID=1872520 RepID=UPI002B212CF1|nr:TnsA endonuclease N-terminal domain-containing protein [Anaeromusa sp.]MEA4834728.1 TnsA endonuclease C-terminal domain-containing protein [Anaeromusa sp.]
MAKYRYAWTEEKIQRYIEEGRGYGEGKEYSPWLRVQSLSSRGRSSRIKGIKNQRIVHLLSDLERDYFYLLDFCDEVVDVREQFPLPRKDTQMIAEKFGYRHPAERATGVVLVMTTDFVITAKDKSGAIITLARTIKQSEELNQKRTLEKLDIERSYWEEKGVNWGIVTEKEIPKQLAKNLAWLHPSYELEEISGLSKETVVSLFKVLQQRMVLNGDAMLKDLLMNLDDEYHLQEGAFLSILRHLMARKEIRMVDWNSPFSIMKKVSEFSHGEGGIEDDRGQSNYFLA